MKIISKIILCCIIFSGVISTQAADIQASRGDAFIYFANQHKSSIPESYQYIDLNFLDISADSALEDALQILVYLDLIKNSHISIHADVKIDSTQLMAMQELLESKVSVPKITINAGLSSSSSDILGDKENILLDVYKTLSSSHYDKWSFEQDQLTQGAIKWIADSVDDKYTSYFPPVESNNFFESLDGEYEWIGSYVEMNAPGELIIVSPIIGSPSEAAWIQAGDKVTHVDDIEVLAENSLQEVITWIKWPADTRVKLTIIRESEKNPIDIYVTRAKIIINNIEHEKLDKDTYYIQIKNFGENVDTEFKSALEAVLAENGVNKIIFDLRNNPGWYLGEVSSMLSYFVESWSPTAVVNYGNRELKYVSKWYNLIDFSNYELVFLQNWGSASASEIMVWTVKDYYSDATIIGTQSYGKGSVQSLKTYSDGSTLKYTTAKWFTGKTKNGIDGIWITPDIELEFDVERYEIYKKDNQLEKAISY